MNVLQLIDSLDAGGAEQIAVHLANQFPKVGVRSFLCTTRAEGILKDQLQEEVAYFHLQKKKTLDLKALKKLKGFIKSNNIDVLHAHTTSFFFATLLKILHPRISLVWHTHLGARAQKTVASNNYIKFCSRFFDAIITVNEDLKTWCLNNLQSKNVSYVPNGVIVNDNILLHENRKEIIVCVANLKEPKNHAMLIDAFAEVHKKYYKWRLQLVGKAFGDVYEAELRKRIKTRNLEDVVTIMGQQKDVPSVIKSCAIGVLSSTHEGLPMALLEYGAAGLAVIATDVGECATVIGDAGIVVPSNNSAKFAKALSTFLDDEALLTQKAADFQKKIISNYTIQQMAMTLSSLYKKLIS